MVTLGEIVVLAGPLFSVGLTVFSQIIRTLIGYDVKAAGGDLAFSAISIQVGFFSTDILVSPTTTRMFINLSLTLIFLIVYGFVQIILKSGSRCPQCGLLLPVKFWRAALAMIVGFFTVTVAVWLRLIYV